MSQRPHHKTAALIESCATAFNVDVGEHDQDKWSAGLTIAKALDTLVDEDHNYNTEAYTQQLLRGDDVPHLTPAEQVFVRNTYHGLSPETQHRWQGIAKDLGAFALKRLEATTVDTYAAVVLDESQLMGNVLTVENTRARPDAQQRDAFNTWMSQMARTAYMVDTLSDIVRDYNEGNTRVRPTFHTAVRLAQHSLAELTVFTRITPAPIYSAIGKRAVTKTLEKLAAPNFLREQFIRARD